MACNLPIVIVQHIAPAFAGHFRDWLSASTVLPVQEAGDGQELVSGTVYLVLRGPSLELKARRAPRLHAVAGDDGARGPSVDALFHSAARIFGRNVLGILLSGMGDDGARGLKAISDAGGRTIVQDEASAMYNGMPSAAIRLTRAHEILSGDAIALALAGAATGRPHA